MGAWKSGSEGSGREESGGELLADGREMLERRGNWVGWWFDHSGWITCRGIA